MVALALARCLWTSLLKRCSVNVSGLHFTNLAAVHPATAARLVSRPGAGVKGERLRQFVCINGRPVELPKALKALNDTYK